MVLVDSSVWIRFLAGREPYATRLDGLLQRDEVVGHPMVYGELLIGDRGGRMRLLNDYGRMRQVAAVPHDEVVAFVQARKLHGRGIGWIDAHLLASAVVERVRLWTADQQLEAAANQLAVS